MTLVRCPKKGTKSLFARIKNHGEVASPLTSSHQRISLLIFCGSLIGHQLVLFPINLLTTNTNRHHNHHLIMRYLQAFVLLLSVAVVPHGVAAAEKKRGLRRSARFERPREIENRDLQETSCCEYQKICGETVVDGAPQCTFICVDWCGGTGGSAAIFEENALKTADEPPPVRLLFSCQQINQGLLKSCLILV